MREFFSHLLALQPARPLEKVLEDVFAFGLVEDFTKKLGILAGSRDLGFRPVDGRLLHAL
jgi:hypothetical protein